MHLALSAKIERYLGWFDLWALDPVDDVFVGEDEVRLGDAWGGVGLVPD